MNEANKAGFFTWLKRKWKETPLFSTMIALVWVFTGIEGAGEKAKWDGKVELITKAEINARARGLAPRVEAVEAEAPKAKKAPAKKAAKAEGAEA